MMRITAYSDRLLDDLDVLDCPTRQGHATQLDRRSPAPRCSSPRTQADIEVFTTRPDTLFGATYMVLAPEHRWSERLTAADWPTRWTRGGPTVRRTPAEAVASYLRRSRRSPKIWSGQENKTRPACSPGAYATNPVKVNAIPVFIATTLLIGYGTGAIMAVPGGDQRDWLRRRIRLPDREVISGGDNSQAPTSRRCAGELRRPRRAERRVGQGSDRRAVGWPTAAAGPVSNTSCRDWLFASSATGASRFRSSTTPTAAPSAAGVDAGRGTSRLRDYSPVQFELTTGQRASPPLGKATEWVHVDLDLDLGDGLKPLHPRHQT